MTDHPTIDARASQFWLAQKMPARTPWLHAEVASRMHERLDWITSIPANILLWNPMYSDRNGIKSLRQRYPKAHIWLLEQNPAHFAEAQKTLRPKWWQRADVAIEVLHYPTNPLGTSTHLPPTLLASMDMVWCNMHLHHASKPTALLQQLAHLLRPDGILMFSCLGPDTLRSLRASYQRQNWGDPSQHFTDMHDWGDALLECGLIDPVMDMESLHLQYPSPERALQELRELGRNLNPNRFAGSRGKGWQEQLKQALGPQPTLEFEVIYGHAIRPQQAKIRLQETTVISMENMRQQLKTSGSPR